MLCQKCKKNISDDSNFCNFCGARQRLQIQKIEDVSASISEVPLVIQETYGQLINLLKNDEIYGALLKIKDVYEITLKYPLIIILSYIEKECNTNSKNSFSEKYNNLNIKLKGFLYDSIIYKLSMGSWETIALELSTINSVDFFYKQKYSKIIDAICQINRINAKKYTNYIDKKNNNRIRISAWRNDTIGHGALNCKNIDIIRNDILEKLLYLNRILIENNEIYKKLLFKNINNNITITMSNSEESICISPFITTVYNTLRENDIFDSYDKSNKKASVINYADGVKKKVSELSNKFIYMHDNIKLNEVISIIEAYNTDKLDFNMVMTNEIHFLNMLMFKNIRGARCFSEWFIKCIENYNGGLFLCTAEMGMGKTAFTRVIDQLDITKVKDNPQLEKYLEKISSNIVIRTFRFNSYWNSDETVFVENLVDIFLKDLYITTSNEQVIQNVAIISKDIWIARDKLKEALFKSKNSEIRQLFTNLLKELLRFWKIKLGKEKLILIIDGIDEIQNNKSIINLQEMLPNNSLIDDIYILVMSRKIKENNMLSEILNKKYAYKIDITRNDERYRKDIINYIMKVFKIKRGDAVNLAEKLNWRYTDITAYKKVYSSMKKELITGNYSISKNILENFFDSISRLSKSYAESIKNMFCLFAITKNGLTIYELSYLLTGDSLPNFKLYGMVMDISDFLMVERNYELGNLFILGNEFWKSQILQNFGCNMHKDEILDSIKDNFIDFVNQDHRDSMNFETIRRAMWLLQEKEEICELMLKDDDMSVKIWFCLSLFKPNTNKEIHQKILYLTEMIENIKLITTDNNYKYWQGLSLYHLSRGELMLKIGCIEKGIFDLSKAIIMDNLYYSFNINGLLENAEKYSKIIDAFMELHKHTVAKQYCVTAINILDSIRKMNMNKCHKVTYSRLVDEIYGYYACIEYLLGKPENVEYICRKGLKLCLEKIDLKEKIHYWPFLIFRSLSELNNKQYDDIFLKYTHQLTIEYKNDNNSLKYIYMTLGHAYEHNKNHVLALDFYEKAAYIIKQILKDQDYNNEDTIFEYMQLLKNIFIENSILKNSINEKLKKSIIKISDTIINKALNGYYWNVYDLLETFCVAIKIKSTMKVEDECDIINYYKEKIKKIIYVYQQNKCYIDELYIDGFFKIKKVDDIDCFIRY